VISESPVLVSNGKHKFPLLEQDPAGFAQRFARVIGTRSLGCRPIQLKNRKSLSSNKLIDKTTRKHGSLGVISSSHGVLNEVWRGCLIYRNYTASRANCSALVSREKLVFASTGYEKPPKGSFDVCPARCVQLTPTESNKSDKSRADNDETKNDYADDDEWVFHTKRNYA
jgi:hypothetical protein